MQYTAHAIAFIDKETARIERVGVFIDENPAAKVSQYQLSTLFSHQEDTRLGAVMGMHEYLATHASTQWLRDKGLVRTSVREWAASKLSRH